MSDLRPRGIPIELDGVERHFLFTLNTIDELQETYGKNLYEVLTDLTQEGGTAPMLRNIVAFLLNQEAARNKRLGGPELPEVTEKDVGDMVGVDNYYEVLSAVLRAYGISMPEADEDEDPNPASGQQNS